MSFLERLKANVLASEDRNQTNIFSSTEEEVLKLYALFLNDTKSCPGELFSCDYVLEKLSRILFDKPIVLHPVLADYYYRVRDNMLNIESQNE